MEETVDPEIEVVMNGDCIPLNEFLECHAGESLHEYIKTNVFIATRNFVQRVNSFRTEVMMGANNPMKIHKYSWKVEFQAGMVCVLISTFFHIRTPIVLIPIFLTTFPN